jgi:hypothetical protein
VENTPELFPLFVFAIFTKRKTKFISGPDSINGTGSEEQVQTTQFPTQNQGNSPFKEIVVS